MTGFGVASRAWEEGPGGRPHQLVVELRGVNQRFRELKLRQPFGPATEQAIRRRIEERIGRGRIDAAIFLQRQGDEGAGLVDPIRLREVLKAVQAAAEISAQEGVEVSGFNALELLSFVGSHARSSGAAAEASLAAPPWLIEELDAALEQLLEMRRVEGAALAQALGELIDTFEGQVAALREGLAGEGDRLLARLTERVSALCERAGTEAPEPSRLVQEVALLIQRGDVEEELARIASHLAQMRGVIAAPAAVGDGKTLDFLAQELFREITTIGSKITSHRGSGLVIAAKGSVERIREQVQNVE